MQEEVKRPPLYYFEEVEEKRARERELLASWYQPIPEPESPIATKPLTPPTTASKPPVETTVVSAVAAGVHQATAASGGAAATTSSTAASAAATPLFSPASSGPRVQVKEGIGPKLPRPNRVRVPTRRELASYGIKLPSQREAEQRARQAERDPHYDDELLSDEEADAMEQDELARQFAATSSSATVIAGKTITRLMTMRPTPRRKRSWRVSLPLPSSSGTLPSSRRAPTRSRRQIMNSRR